MYPELKTTNTWAWIKAIANSKKENAIINNKGKNPIIPIKPALKIWKVNPLNIANNICPANILAANLNPKIYF